jgi:uncharacterized membrane protein YedE/YeeE
MDHFTPLSAAGGGLLIGAAASVLWLSLGRIAGISGIVGGIARSVGTGDAGWRLAFLAGLLATPLLYRAAGAAWPVVSLGAPASVIVAAGLLVGFGTRLGSGCTSGHGVCGSARLSPRSVVSTATFMAVAAATVFVVRHATGGLG